MIGGLKWMARMPAAALHVVEGGDHSFNVRGEQAPSKREIYDAVIDVMVEWIERQA